MRPLACAGLLLAGCATAPPLPPFPASHPGSPAAEAAPLPPRSDALAMPTTPGGSPANTPATPTPGRRGH